MFNEDESRNENSGFRIGDIVSNDGIKYEITHFANDFINGDIKAFRVKDMNFLDKDNSYSFFSTDTEMVATVEQVDIIKYMNCNETIDFEEYIIENDDYKDHIYFKTLLETIRIYGSGYVGLHKVFDLESIVKEVNQLRYELTEVE
jgi:hypothetical protein